MTVDHNGFTYYTQHDQFFLYVLPSQTEETYFYASTDTCAIGSTCALYDASIAYNSIGALATDPNGTVFLNTFESAAKLVPSPTIFDENYTPLYIPFSYNSDYYSSPQPLAVDSSDNLYTFYNTGSGTGCQISGQSLYSAESNVFNPSIVVGGKVCGFSGDGGQARSAQIGKEVGQMAFDIAGNLYFTDTLNQRVRRVDGATGIITTIAGNGAAAYYGDNGPATAAALNTPTGVGVDSQGQVYIISQTAASATSQVVRKVGVVGALNFGNAVVGTPSGAQTVTLANTGNSQLDFTHVGFSSGNTSDFVIDPNTTSCNFTVALASGRSCKIGFIFTPGGTGVRSAVLSITDDTIAGLNTIQLSGAGYTTAALTPASLSFASTNVGASTAAQVATLTNTGKAIMTINSILLSGTGATSYTDSTNCGTTLAVGASCTISVTFKPAAVGSLPATLTVTDNAITGRQTVALTGTGLGVAKAALSPTSLTYASTKVGSTSAAQTVSLSNPGTAALTITSIGMTGTNAADFPLTKTCGTSLAVGASCSISVSFKPSATGTRTATVSAVTSAGTVTAAVSGTAVAAAVVKSSVTLISAANPMATNSAVVLTAKVAGTSTVIPTGNVQLVEAGQRLASGVLSDGSVTFSLIGLTRGLHTLQAIYGGDSLNSGSTSALLGQVVMPGLRRISVSPPPVHAPEETKPPAGPSLNN